MRQSSRQRRDPTVRSPSMSPDPHTPAGIGGRVVRALMAVGAATAVALAAPAALASQDRPAADRHLHGVVEDARTGEPIEGAQVAVDLGSGRPRGALTGADGAFDFRGLPARSVAVTVRRIGYATWTRTVDLTTDDVLLHVRLALATTELEAVEIVTDTLVDPLARVTATTTLAAAALAATRGQTLGETIKYLPGVSTIQFGPSIAKPVVRGLNSQRVLVMNGGVRQEDQQWGTEHAPNIDAFAADAVTVVRGAATVLYGPDAIGGVVRVDQAEVPRDGGSRGDVALNTFSNSRQGAASVGVEGGDLDLPGIGRAGYRARLTTRVAGNGAAPDYFLANTGFRELNGSLTLGVHRDWGMAEAHYSRFATELGVLSQAHVGNFDDLQRAMMRPPRDSSFTYGIDAPRQQVAHQTLRLKVRRSTAAHGTLEATYGLQYNHRQEFDAHGPLRFRDVAAFNLKLFTNTLDVRWRHPQAKGLLGTVGASLMAQGNQTLGKAFLIPGFDFVQGALYAQEELTTGRLTWSAGARTDVVSQTVLPFDDAGIVINVGTRRWSGFAGSLGSELRITDGLSASARLARAWRPPTVNERYAQGVHHGTAQYELGDPSLDAERSLGLETTVRWEGARTRLEVAAYENRVDQFIYLAPRAPVQTIRGAFPGFTYESTDARLRGLEVAASWSPLAVLGFDLTGNVVRGTARRTGIPLFDMPADRLTARTRWSGSHPRLGRWTLGASAILVRQQDQVPEATIYALPTDGYALFGFDVGTTDLTLLGQALDVTLSVNNAFDARYRDYLSRYRLFVDDPGRDVALRIRVPIGR